MRQDHEAYYRSREAVARGLAERAVNPVVSRIHLEMADRYATMAREAPPPPPPPAVPE